MKMKNLFLIDFRGKVYIILQFIGCHQLIKYYTFQILLAPQKKFIVFDGNLSKLSIMNFGKWMEPSTMCSIMNSEYKQYSSKNSLLWTIDWTCYTYTVALELISQKWWGKKLLNLAGKRSPDISSNDYYAFVSFDNFMRQHALL